MDIIQTIGQETQISIQQISSVIDLLSEGNTIPFIARYRKEKTNNLDEVQLRSIRDRFDYMTELESRKEVILKSIEEQEKLTDELSLKIRQITTKQALEDLYLPYKPKKRTRATIAKEKGLEPLAELMRDQQDYQSWLQEYLAQREAEIEEIEAKQRARDIVAEWISEDAEIREKVRDLCRSQGVIKTEVQKEHKDEKTKFEMYYDYSEPARDIPAHRYLAIRRGEEESIIKIRFEFPIDFIIETISEKWISFKDKSDEDLTLTIKDSYQRLIAPSIEVDIRLELKTRADEESIKVFSENLKNLLLAPLGGAKMIMGLDPGLRTGTKLVIVDETGKYLEKTVIYPTPPKNQIAEAKTILTRLFDQYPCQYICIGNGTGSREVMQFTKAYLKEMNKPDVQPIIVNESGASIYSASEIAREEFPDLDLSFRGSISIARRFQDPLAELVKIDAKSIGVGQYQHDVNQKNLKKSLDEVVESCVNFVGVNLNTASASLLSYVSGMNKTLAKNVVTFRNENGAFKERKDLKKVTRFGPKSFEQSAGFLRIINGTNPLDNSAVHPENYKLILKMADDHQLPIADMIGNDEVLNRIDLTQYKTEDAGLITLTDIIAELKKPGRDPRTAFVGAKLQDDIQTIQHLEEGMELEGTVTNLTNFGAFVDLGVHQDGLVHVSQLSDRFVKEPSEICSVGDIVKVRVLSIDINRKRIALTMKSKNAPERKRQKPAKKSTQPKAPVLTGSTETSLAKLSEKFGKL